MAIVYATGFETGGTEEIVSLGAGASIVTSPVRATGNYSLSAVAGLTTLVNPGGHQIVCRFYFQIATLPSGANISICRITTASDTLDLQIGGVSNLFVITDVTATWGLSGTVIGTHIPAINTWYRIEIAVDNTANGAIKVWMDDVSSGDTGGPTLEISCTHTVGLAVYNAISVRGGASSVCTFDDILIATGQTTPLGPGRNIARQGLAGTPTYDAWTKNGAATAALCWSDTPFSTATNCTSSTSGAAQTMLVEKFSITQTGHGTGTVGSGDTINAASVVIVAKGSTSTNLSIRRRINGTDTDTAITITTTDKGYDDGPWTTTPANLDLLEAGILHPANANSRTIEDVWVCVDYTPGAPQAPLFIANLDMPAPDRYPMENRGFVKDLDLHLIGQDKFYGPAGLAPYVPDWRVPPERPRSRQLTLDPQAQRAQYITGKETLPNFIPNLDKPFLPARRLDFQRETQAQRAQYIPGKETLPKAMANLDLPAARRYPMENRGFIKDLDLHLIGKDVLPNFTPDLTIPRPPPRLRTLTDWVQNLLQTTLGVTLPAYLCGFETGDASELLTLGAGASIQTVIVRSGQYALQAPSITSTFTQSLSTTKHTIRMYAYWANSVTSITNMGRERSSTPANRLQLTTVAGPVIQLNDSGATLGLSASSGSTVLQPNQWYRIEIALDLAAGGIVRLWLTPDATGITSLEIDTTHTNDVSGTPTTGWTCVGAASPNFVYFDDVRIDTNTLTPPGAGKIIARQGMPGAPTYDAWAKNGATTAWQAWSDTPFNTATNATSSTSAAAQTMLVAQFSTPQAGRGPELIGPSDVVTALKIGAIFKRATGGSPKLRLRASGADTDTTITGSTVDAWGQAILAALTPAALDSMEAGMVKAADANLTTVEDVWVMVEARTWTGAVPFYPIDWRVPPPIRRQALLADIQAPANPALLLIGQETLPKGFLDTPIPPRRLFARSLLDWTGQPIVIPPTPAIVTAPAPASGGIGHKRRNRYPEAPASPFEGYTTDQLRRMVEMELPRLDKAEWQRAEEAVKLGTVSRETLDALPAGFDLMRARAIEVGAGLLLAELRAAKLRRDAETEEDELIAMLLLFS